MNVVNLAGLRQMFTSEHPNELQFGLNAKQS